MIPLKERVSFWMWLGKVAPILFFCFIGLSLVIVIKAGAVIFGLVRG